MAVKTWFKHKFLWPTDFEASNTTEFPKLEFRREILEFRKISFHSHGGNLYRNPLEFVRKILILSKKNLEFR